MTDEMKHTPGPWQNIGNCRIHGTPAYAGIDQSGPGGEWEGVPVNSIQEVCVAFPASVYGYSKGGKDYPVRKDVQERWWARNNANIDLICAAPELLEALKALEKYGHTQAVWANALKAIAKAEGRSK